MLLVVYGGSAYLNSCTKAQAVQEQGKLANISKYLKNNYSTKEKLQEKITEFEKENKELRSRGQNVKLSCIGKSNITSEQLEKVLTNSNLVGLSNSFLAAEQETNVNAVCLTAIAIHESGWGTNQLTIQKNNIMSICAYDWNPLGAATTYKTKTACILDGAWLLKHDYLTETGKYFNGATLDGINVKYATDKSWASKVRNIISQIMKGV